MCLSAEQLSIIDSPLSSSIMTGDTIKFACKAKGFPYPRYQWYRAHTKDGEGDEIIYDEVSGAVDSVLEIQAADCSHSGGYCCKVYHIPNGKECSKFTDWAYLTVLRRSSGPPSTSPGGQIRAPPVIRHHPEANLNVNQGQELVLTCRATGCPKPEFQWFKYEDNPKTGAVERKLIEGYNSEVLQFAQATLGDSGQYICYVANTVSGAWSNTSNVKVTTMAQNLMRRCHIEILRDPIDVQCIPGAPQTLECLASCSTAKLHYQWYKNEHPMEGETSHQLCFPEMKMTDAGRYFCRVTADSGQSVDSKVAELKFPIPKERFTATDKVALLIGNEAYRSGDLLSAPGNDMEKLARNLYEMQFKVVSLLNLTVAEMKKALKIFCSLLDDGVYGLFYFSGHGFEKNGQTYMVPADAPTGYYPKECMCAQEVLENMQGRNTALNVILLDICRKINDMAQGEVEVFTPKVTGNTVYGYAAQINSEAYEVSKHGYAIFTKYLEKRIKEDKCIYDIIRDVMKDVSGDHDAGNKQFPAIMGDLTKELSLQDAIQYTGHTSEFNIRNEAWTRSHELPHDIRIPLVEPPRGIEAHVEFGLRFSNVMVITTTIVTRGVTTWCEAFPTEFPSQVDIKLMKGQMPVPDANGRQCQLPFYKATIENIQRIERREDFTFTLIVNYEFQGKRFQDSVGIKIERPLISQVWLMEDDGVEGSFTEAEYPDSTTSNSLM
nr:mucosa-associated lymphoid tissue lymphoma translocation protein 1-like [Lytechinus pictus]